MEDVQKGSRMMLSLNEWLESLNQIEVIELTEDTAASTTTSGVANPDGKVLTSIKRDKFMGHTCYEIDEDSYCNLIQGKTPFKHWAGYISDETVRNEVKTAFYKNKKLLVRNEKTGSMIYVK
jgi:hypothetical protein